MNNSMLIAGNLDKIGRTQLTRIPIPVATATHKPVPHYEIVEALIETWAFATSEWWARNTLPRRTG